jgi:2-methylcitrate dehydratase PrpD
MTTFALSLAQTLAAYAVNLKPAALPADVRHEGERAFLNWVGCALGGADEGTVACALDAFDRFSGPRVATVIGRAGKADIFLAAFANGIGSSVHSFNDTHFATVAHPTSPVAAALFALAQERPVPGSLFLTALILGIELQCRVGNMLTTPPAQCGVGLSMVGLVGGIGAAVACGKALGLDEEAMTRAIGIAANSACGLREAHASMSSHYTPGHAARCGLEAALLAQSGYGCPPGMLDGEKGFGVSFATDADPAAALARLGESFEILLNAYKPYPCGFVIHPAIDGCLDLARSATIDPTAIESVVIEVNALAIKLTSRPAPQNRRQALVSLQHWAAASLTRSKAGLAEGSDETVHDPAIAALRARVTLVERSDFGRETATIHLQMRDGSRHEAHVADCRGSINRPMTDAELDEKFRDQAALVLMPARIDALREAIDRLPDSPDAGALGALLAP